MYLIYFDDPLKIISPLIHVLLIHIHINKINNLLKPNHDS